MLFFAGIELQEGEEYYEEGEEEREEEEEEVDASPYSQGLQSVQGHGKLNVSIFARTPSSSTL